MKQANYFSVIILFHFLTCVHFWLRPFSMLYNFIRVHVCIYCWFFFLHICTHYHFLYTWNMYYIIVEGETITIFYLVREIKMVYFVGFSTFRAANNECYEHLNIPWIFKLRYTRFFILCRRIFGVSCKNNFYLNMMQSFEQVSN